MFVCNENLHKYLNENLKINVISELGYKVMNFRDKSKQVLCLFSHQIYNIYSRTQSCNDNKLTPMCFFVELTITYFGKIKWLFHYLITLWCSYLYLSFIYIT